MIKSNSTEVLHHYNEDHSSIVSAEEIVPYVVDIVKPSSVVDVGCGLGQWAATFKKYGVKEILGIDGAHVPRDKMFISEDEFDCLNFEDKKSNSHYLANKKFDLVLSLEVAEHLNPKIADDFVLLLTSLGDVILFSAAIPGQTGENHHNEQYHSYWQEKFSKYEYEFIDIFRRDLWNNDQVHWWYRQNMFLVVSKNTVHNFKHLESGDLNNVYIHPELFKYRIEYADIFSRYISGKLPFSQTFAIGIRAVLNKFGQFWK